MTEINGTGGLCMTCNNAPTCYYHATRGPALFCEMFDNYVPSAVRMFHEKPSPADISYTPSRPVVEEVSYTPSRPVEEEYVGLCMNCDHRTTCMHPRPVGGVWHCEDYE